MMISEETINRVRDASDIVSVIAEYIPNLKRAGKDFKGLCPFHQEKTPSFMVSPAKGIFHCFGCGKGGDVFKFVMEMERCSYPEAIEKLADRKGIPVSTEKGYSAGHHLKQREKKKSLLEVLNRAMQFYHKKLLESEEAQSARHYLFEKRKIRPEIAKKFVLGWAPSGGQALASVALKSGFSEADLMSSGLSIRSQRDGKLIDWFRGRIIFPIFNAKGQVIAFGGRVLESGEPSGENPPPKYINSPETEVFQKGKNLYGFYHGAKAIRETNRAVVVEGYMDVIGCHQAGIENVVGPLGTSLTSDQCQILKRHVEHVTLLFDSDTAGENAASRGAELLLEFDFWPTIAQIPSGKDADEYLKNHSAEDFNKVLQHSLNFAEFKIQLLLNKNQGVPLEVNRVLASQVMVSILLKIKNEIIRSEMIRHVANRLSISEQSIYAELKKAKTKPAHRVQADQATEEKNNVHSITAEEELICRLYENPILRQRLAEMQEVSDIFFNERLAECYKLLKESSETLDKGQLMNKLSEASSQWLSSTLMRLPHIEEDQCYQLFDSLLKRIKSKKLRERHKNLAKRISENMNKGESPSGDEVSEYQLLTQTLKGSHIARPKVVEREDIESEQEEVVNEVG